MVSQKDSKICFKFVRYFKCNNYAFSYVFNCKNCSMDSQPRATNFNNLF